MAYTLHRVSPTVVFAFVSLAAACEASDFISACVYIWQICDWFHHTSNIVQPWVYIFRSPVDSPEDHNVNPAKWPLLM